MTYHSFTKNNRTKDEFIMHKAGTEGTKDFLEICQQRGLVYQTSDSEGLAACLTKQPECTAYIGFDPTAPALHAGNLIQVVMLRWYQKCGKTPVALIGGGTALIGDPSGKDRQRVMMSAPQIAANVDKFSQSLKKLFDKDSALTFVNNAEWLLKLGYLEILREVGPHFSMAKMLAFDSVRLRMERQQNLSFLEFNYMVLQAYDFLNLARNHNCRLQIGGSDQWGNIVSGIELNRRIDERSVYGLTTPLLSTASGTKMGKTENGAVWLDSNLMPVFDFWQFWRNTDDRDVTRFLKIYTEIPLHEITRFESVAGAELNDGKILLANSVTSLVHGEAATQKASRAASGVFQASASDGFDNMLDGLDTVTQSVNSDSGSALLIDLLCLADLASSKSDARRLIAGGGVRVDGEIVADITTPIAWKKGQSHRLSVGKKRHKRVLWQSET